MKGNIPVTTFAVAMMLFAFAFSSQEASPGVTGTGQERPIPPADKKKVKPMSDKDLRRRLAHAQSLLPVGFVLLIDYIPPVYIGLIMPHLFWIYALLPHV